MSSGCNRRAALYSVAAVIGVTLALVDIIERPQRSVDDVAVARVGDVNIPLRRYRELLSDVASDSRQPLTDSDRQFALQRLIDEELLVLRARELGLEAVSRDACQSNGHIVKFPRHRRQYASAAPPTGPDAL